MIRDRCDVCGGPLDENRECPDLGGFHPKQADAYTPPPEPRAVKKPRPPRHDIGQIAMFPWPTDGTPTLGMVTSTPDMEGTIGLMIVAENVRVNQDDVERID